MNNQMDRQTSEKNCACTISDQTNKCTGDHAKNLADAARYMMNKQGDIEMPRRVRTPSRSRDEDEPILSYVDPPLPRRDFPRYESSGQYTSSPKRYSANNFSGEMEQEIQNLVPLSLRDSTGRQLGIHSRNMVEDSQLRQMSLEPMDKYEALKINGKEIHEIAIGGFQVDLNKITEKVRDEVALPPARLPIIFVDNKLNFYHHFFNGIYEIVQYDDLMDVVNSDPDKNDSDFILNTIDELLTTGYERSDSESMVLIKRMLNSTFKSSATSNRRTREKVLSLYVETNIWGFPYIQQSMTCKEVDLRYWMKACHKEYENAWYGAFKSTRTPVFARSVKRSSRSSQSSSKPSLRSIDEATDDSIADIVRSVDEMSTISRSRHRRTRPSRRSSNDNTSRINNWFAS
jgi:hypothetical protein